MNTSAAYEKHPEDSTLMEEEKVPRPSDVQSPESEIPATQTPRIIVPPGGEGGKIMCKICGKSFNSKTELEMHLESQHRIFEGKQEKKMEG